jgi:nucleoside-diphosphate-sugar epimerase
MMKELFTKKNILLKGDGNIKRDFLFVRDAINGMIRLAENCTSRSVNGKAITFASGNLSSIRQIAEIVQRTIPFATQVSFDNRPFDDRDHPLLDIRSANELLGWSPQYSLEKGMRETVPWYHHYFLPQGGN